jgi:ribonuclease P/MRP protein subunit POP8
LKIDGSQLEPPISHYLLIKMTQNPSQGSQKNIFQQKDLEKSHDILTCTIKEPPFSYAHLELITNALSSSSVTLDDLSLKSYCTAACRQFLGTTGAAISTDILKVENNHAWVRVPRPDLGSFAAAITAWRGTSDNGEQVSLQLRQCSDWLGAMVGADGQHRLWNS